MTDGEGANRTEVGVESPIRVYVGSEEAQELAVKVLEYSIRRRASMDVEVFPLHHARMEFPMPKDARNRPRTPFSFQRFNIPALKGYRGRAIYLDSDMQVFQDIKALWTLPFDGADLLAARERGGTGRKPQFSVMLLNCEELRWDITEIVARLDRGELTYETLMYEMAVARKVSAAISPEWNSLERYVEGETALLHYTDMPTQPWVSRDNPLGHLWVRDLIAATEAGFITRQYVEEQVHLGLRAADREIPTRSPHRGRAPALEGGAGSRRRLCGTVSEDGRSGSPDRRRALGPGSAPCSAAWPAPAYARDRR